MSPEQQQAWFIKCQSMTPKQRFAAITYVLEVELSVEEEDVDIDRFKTWATRVSKRKRELIRAGHSLTPHSAEHMSPGHWSGACSCRFPMGNAVVYVQRYYMGLSSKFRSLKGGSGVLLL